MSNAYRHDRLYSDRIFRRLDEKQLRCAYVMVWTLSWGMSGAAPATITMPRMNRFLLFYGNEQAVAVYGCIGYITAIIYLRPDREIEMELCDSTRNKSEFCMVSQPPLD